LKEAFDRLVPNRVARFKPEFGEFANAKIAKLRKRRDRFVKLFKKTSDEYYMIKARIETKKMKKRIKKERARIIQVKLKTPNPKSFWSVVNNLLGKRIFNPSIELKMKDDNGDISMIKDATIVSDLFVKFFRDKVLNLAKKLPNSIRHHTTNINPIVYTSSDLELALKNTKSKHCHGFNGIPLRIAKDFCQAFPSVALYYFNLMSKNGLSDAQREARIIPLHKKGSKSEISNYRPIANLCSLSKIYEKLLYQRLLSETEGLEGLYQHGFRKCHSTTTALLQLQDVISKHLEGGRLCLVYSVDLSAAFDVFRPDLFVQMFDKVLSHGLAFSISDFLWNRKIACDVFGARSVTLDMPIGCVQGSTLGPRLFTLYMGKLSEKLCHPEVIGFADDTYVVISGDDIESIKYQTHSISTRHVGFLESLGMVVNKTKTEAIIFSKDPICVDVNFAGTTITTTKSIKALGLTVSHDLKWQCHLDTALSKASAKLSLTRKIRPLLTMSQFLQVATSQIFSTIYYAAPVWLNNTLGHKLWTKINSFHYRVMRVACNDFKRRKKKEVIDSLCKRATPKMWSQFVSSSIAMKIIREGSPVYLSNAILEHMVIERRKPRNGRFFDGSRLKIGRHQIGNRLNHMNSILDPWLNPTPSNDSIRTLLKKHLNFDFK
jgi:hypothetical protein